MFPPSNWMSPSVSDVVPAPRFVLIASLKLNGHKARIVDFNGCMECGACMNNCPAEAINLHPGVGCAEYIIRSWLKGKNRASCGTEVCC